MQPEKVLTSLGADPPNQDLEVIYLFLTGRMVVWLNPAFYTARYLCNYSGEIIARGVIQLIIIEIPIYPEKLESKN